MHATFCFDFDLCINFLEGRKNFLQNMCKGYDLVVMFLRNCQELKSDIWIAEGKKCGDFIFLALLRCLEPPNSPIKTVLMEL